MAGKGPGKSSGKGAASKNPKNLKRAKKDDEEELKELMERDPQEKPK